MSHCLRFRTLATAQSSGSHTRRLPAPGPTAAFSGGPSSFAWSAPPQFSDRVQDSVGLSSFLTADVAVSSSPQSLRLQAALATQCLALVWKSSYCKETYLRLLIAVWFGVFLQTPFVPWGQQLRWAWSLLSSVEWSALHVVTN